MIDNIKKTQYIHNEIEEGAGYLCSQAPQYMRDNAKYIVINKEKAKEAYSKVCNGGGICFLAEA